MSEETQAPTQLPTYASYAAQSKRILSLDTFRGFTILGMVFVIAVAAGDYFHESGHLPQKMRWFGSPPVSTWFHAEAGWELWHEEMAASGATQEEIEGHDLFPFKNIGVTFTDLVAPWFVFIVGACIPLTRRRGLAFWTHVLWRTVFLIVLGMIYISLVIRQISWWWGVLQAIGIAYLCGALVYQLPSIGRWVAVFVVGLFNLLMTEVVPWWTGAWESLEQPFWSLSNPAGHVWKPLIIHCQPWLSLSYGVMTMIGVLLGEALVTNDRRRILRRCLELAGIFIVLGYLIHKIGLLVGNHSLAMNKPDVTTSYAFFTAGLGALVFLGFYWVIDVWRVRFWTRPLDVFGTNPLLAYFMMIVMRRVFDAFGITDPEGWNGIFARVTDANTTVHSWAVALTGWGVPEVITLEFFRKSGYHGVMWGLIWTLCLWLIVVWFNRRNVYWKI
jgi:predicted acyltransferase